MRLITTGLRNTLRQMNKDNLDSSAVVQEQVSIKQPGAANNTDWSDLFTVPCRLSAPAAKDAHILQAAKVDVKKAFWVVFEYDVPVDVANRFIVTTPSSEVVTVYPVGGNFPRDVEVMRKILCEAR